MIADGKIGEKVKRVKVNTKIMLIGMLLGLILSTSSYVLADTLINSKNVYYKDNSGLLADNVKAKSIIF